MRRLVTTTVAILSLAHASSRRSAVLAFQPPLSNRKISKNKTTPGHSTNGHLHPNHRPLHSQYIPLDDGNDSTSRTTTSKPSASSSSSSPLPGPLRNDNDIESLLEYIIPTLSPILAFFTYEYVAQGFSALVEMFSDNNWFAVDGGQLQAKVIAPAINGIVVPAIALLYATLTSTSISTLRQRQVDIRRSINLEAGELRNLGHLVYLFPESQVRDLCRTLLLQYVRRLLQESRPHVSDASDAIDPRKGMDTELNGFLIQIHEGYDSIPAHLSDQAFAAVARLREYRMTRITALQSTYPLLHWVTLGSLAFATCTCFLIETNQDVLYFLQAFQLKLLWATLIGTFVSCFTVFYDLGSPFAGQYKITASIDQLENIKVALKAAMERSESEMAMAAVNGINNKSENDTTVLDSSDGEDTASLSEASNSNEDTQPAVVLPIVVKEEDSHFFPPSVDTVVESTTGITPSNEQHT